MTIEELESLLEWYRTPNDVDGQVFLQGRFEGHADIACLLAKAMHCEKEKLTIVGLLRRARNLQEAVMYQLAFEQVEDVIAGRRVATNEGCGPLTRRILPEGQA